MKQKLFHVALDDYYGNNTEIKLPNAVEGLIAEGWYIKQISSFGAPFANLNDGSAVVLLLQKD